MSSGRAVQGYRNPTLPIEARVSDLLGRMTLQEKCAQLRSAWLRFEHDGRIALHEVLPGWQPDQAELFLRDGIGHVTRPFGTHPIPPQLGARSLNAVQRFLIERTRLGIPALPHDECLSGLMAAGATQFAAPINLGSTWDPELVREAADVIRRQMRALGTRQGLAPVADVVRDARWGRVEECYGEDPYLVGVFVTRYVQGLQGSDLRDGVAATPKHMAAHSFGEGGRNLAPVRVGSREMADVFLLPFEMAIKTGQARAVMTAYHDLDSVPATACRWLLTDVLRDAWRFDGTVVADYNSVRFLYVKHRIVADAADASAAALQAGMDVELPGSECFLAGLPESLRRGTLDEAMIDRSVARLLATKFELGLFESPYVDVDAIAIDSPSDRAVARRVAQKSLVLLKNDGVLPLVADIGRIALIGPNADDALALFGDYTFPVHVASRIPGIDAAAAVPSILDALRERAGAHRVMHAPGCRILTKIFREVRHPLEGPTPDPSIELVCRDTRGIAAAVEAARQADVAVLVVGDRSGPFQTGTVGEGSDTDNLSLPGVQPELVDAVLACGKPVVLVLVNGRPPALGVHASRAAAILEAWFPGQEGAAAIVGALFGDHNPGGKTTVTFSTGAGAQPLYYNHRLLSGGLPRAPHAAPVFPFGHGVGYSAFDYGALELACERVPIDGEIRIGCVVRNSGRHDGDEVVQLYVHDRLRSVAAPVIELKGFRRLSIAAGAAQRVTFTLPTDLLCFHGAGGERVVEPGVVDLLIGASSADIRLRASVELVGAVRRVGGNWRMESASTVQALPVETGGGSGHPGANGSADAGDPSA